MDDWVLATYNIPSVTGEIGNESDFNDEWTAKSKNMAYEIVRDNHLWIEHTLKKIGTQIQLEPKHITFSNEAKSDKKEVAKKPLPKA